MSYLVDGYHHGNSAAAAPVSERVAFIRRTYAHVGAAVLAFVGLSALIIANGWGEKYIKEVMLANKFSMVLLMVLFIGGGYLTQYLARAENSVQVRYAALTADVLLYVLMFVPILYIATTPRFGGNVNLPIQAGIVTLMVFAGLTAAVFISGKDFSFLGPVLMVCSFLALGVILASVFFGFNLGLVFCALMVGLFAAYIIYDTSNMIHRYQTDDHVLASIHLFGALAMLFYYILRLFLLTRDE